MPHPATVIYLVDASVYVFRAYYSIPADMVDGAGNLINAVYGYARFLGDLLERAQPTHIVVAFDESINTSFRNDIYPEYKANREDPPEDLMWQFRQCKRVTAAMGVTSYADERFEADDIIGTLAYSLRERAKNFVVVTRDKDLAQLIRSGDEYWDYAANRRYGYDDIVDKIGVRAEQIPDFLALAGDSVDNIPGVPGVGPKTAIALLQYFDTLDSVYENLDEVAKVPVRGAKKLGARLAQHEEKARLSRQLTGVARDAPVENTMRSMRWSKPDLAMLESLYDELDIGDALRLQAKRLVNG
ncbi:MAG: exodeoxyribonuclease IX [Gammaproteobacteria bacterium]|nr:exodeoxyribonuclease IX [Gammaproteobacteria bacterium]NNF60335.1 exodeoxyribonuclease IX [Gammaproteobacteria bacterium]NNM20621.1 exodeoxyribonuclease IX [Gammaproteobacteria bacterium]